MFRVIFVCTANICRSPMAEYCLKQLIQREGLAEQILSESAGTLAVDGMPITEKAAQVCAEHGLDASAHRSRHVNIHLLRDANLILGMELHHKSDLQIIFPQFASKIYLLKEYGRENRPENYSILDPYGQTIEAYRKTFSEIETVIQNVWPEIKKQVASPLKSVK